MEFNREPVIPAKAGTHLPNLRPSASTVAKFLACPGPAILYAIADPSEIRAMPHIKPGQAVRFGIANMRELMGILD